MNAKKWLNNPLLQFNAHTTTKVATGEILKETQTAIYKGLRFVVTPMKKGGLLCSVRGSLHKYHNQGKHNANDFNINDFRGVVGELKSLFDIDPKRAILRSVEVGVNIETPIPTKEIIKNLVAYNNKGFESMIIDGKATGRTIQKQQYQLKAYDKKQQHPTATTAQHLTRFEIAVKRMAYLSKYKITTLESLVHRQTWQDLGNTIVTAWDNIIYIDRTLILGLKRLTQSQRLRFLFYANPVNWERFKPQQRARAKKLFKNMVFIMVESNPKDEISEIICQKIEILTDISHFATPRKSEVNTAGKCICFNHDLGAETARKTAGKCICFNHDLERQTAPNAAGKCICFNHDLKGKKSVSRNEQQKNVYDLTIDKRLKHIQTPKNREKTLKNDCVIICCQKCPKNTPEKSHKKNPKKDRPKCHQCKTDISHKKKGSKYCGKKCNNKYNGQRRTSERRAKLGQRKCHQCQTDINHKKAGAKYCGKSCNNKFNYLKMQRNDMENIKKEDRHRKQPKHISIYNL